MAQYIHLSSSSHQNSATFDDAHREALPSSSLDISNPDSVSDSSLLLPTPHPEISPSHVRLRSQTSYAPHMYASDGFALLVGIQVGSGIFASPSAVNNNVPSPGAALMVWVVSGLLAWMGATSFAELGAAITKNGGMQEYLRYIYGELVAFLMSWTWLFAVKPSAMAILSIVIAEYSKSAIPIGSLDSYWHQKVLALLALLVMVLLNSISANTTSRIGKVFLVIKFTTVMLIVLCGLITAFTAGAETPAQDWRSRNWFASRPIETEHLYLDWSHIHGWTLIGYYSSALYAGLWAHGGWDNVNFVAGELHNPGRNLPLCIHAAMPVVIICFQLTNISYYITLPWKVLSTSTTVAVNAVQNVFGTTGGVFCTVLVGVSCLGSLSANVFATGRLTVAAAEQGYLPGFLRRSGFWKTNKRHETGVYESANNSADCSMDNSEEFDLRRTPIEAMIFNALITALYIIIGNFMTLVTLVGIAEYTFFFLTVVGLVILRVKDPLLYRPYRPWILSPIVFSVVTGMLILRGIIFAPIQGSIVIFFIITGVAMHILKARRPNWSTFQALS